MKARRLLVGTIISCFVAVNAFGLDCSLSVTKGPGSAYAFLGNATLWTGPTSSRLSAEVREFKRNQRDIVISLSNTFNRTPATICSLALFACPSIVRNELNRPCRRTPTLVRLKNSVVGVRNTYFQGRLRPVRLEVPNRQTQVTFQLVSTCGSGDSVTIIKSDVAAINVTCRGGLTMNQFMKQLAGRIR